MKLFFQILVPVALLTASGIFLYPRLVRGGSSSASGENVPVEQVRQKVSVVLAEPRTQSFPIRSSGFLAPRERSEISAEVAGKMIEASPKFQVGEFLKQGEKILALDAQDYRIAVDIAKSNVSLAEKLFEEEQRVSEESIENWKKRNSSDKEPPPTISREPQVDTARNNLAVARAELEKAEVNLERTEILAPFDGLLIHKHAGIGQFLTPGVPVATLVAVDYAVVRLPIRLDDEAYLDLPRGPLEGNELEVDLHFSQGVRRGRIVRTENRVDEKTRTYYAVARLDDPYLWYSKKGDDLSPVALGEYVQVVVNSKPVEGLTELPNTVLRSRDEVVLVDENDSVSIRKVAVVHESPGTVLVSGLSAGDRVVKSPVAVREGEKVVGILDKDTSQD